MIIPRCLNDIAIIATLPSSTLGSFIKHANRVEYSETNSIILLRPTPSTTGADPLKPWLEESGWVYTD
jgi:hypothetical protein